MRPRKPKRAELVRQERQTRAELDNILGGGYSEERDTKKATALMGPISLDLRLRGIPPAGLVEIFGAESTGKTALLFHAIATAQKAGMDCLLCATEVFDAEYAQVLGVDLSRLALVVGIEPAAAIELLEDFADG